MRSDHDYFKSQDWMTKKLKLMRQTMPKFWVKQMEDHKNWLLTDIYYKNIIFAFKDQFKIPMVQQLPRYWKEQFVLQYDVKDGSYMHKLFNSDLPSFNKNFDINELLFTKS